MHAVHNDELWKAAPNVVTAKLMGDLHLRPRELVKVPLRVDDCLRQGDKDCVYSIHTLTPDYMRGNGITDVGHQADGEIGWHIMQNPSKAETVSFPTGLQVATITQHKSMEEYLKHSGHDEMPSWVSLVATEPLDQTKNRQRIAELPGGHRLLKEPDELAKLTDPEDGKEFHEWSEDIGSQFGWGEKTAIGCTRDVAQSVVSV